MEKVENSETDRICSAAMCSESERRVGACVAKGVVRAEAV